MTNLESFKIRLEKEQDSLETQLGTIGRPNAESPGDWEAIQRDAEQEADSGDQAELLEQYQENSALVDILNKRHRDVLDALVRIENGSYGICAISGDPIENERLEADPAARTCKAHLS
jgi:RNA polymerase-binding transcription factor DksA